MRRFISHRAVIVDGVRTPFQAAGTGFKDLWPHSLQAAALKGLADKHPDLNLKDIDRVVCGTVIQEVKTSNVAREAALTAGFPDSVPAHTVTLACISSNVALAGAVDSIRAGSARSIIIGGVESMSDVPIRFSRNVRKRLIASQKVKSPMGYLGLLAGLKISDLAPELPAIAEFSSNETMGHSADRLASRWGATRVEQDHFALRSHQLAAKAIADGHIAKELISVNVPPKFNIVSSDNLVRGDTTLDKLSSLKAAFVKPYGTVTAGNSSALTDGASASLIMSEERARELGLKGKCVVKDYLFVSQDPVDELLLGPAYATGRILDRNGLKASDIGVFEFHEAFAAQVVANLHALNSKAFQERAGHKNFVGEIDRNRLNKWGGSLSLGHPFGATGCRITTTAANRLHFEDQNLALVTACAAGGQAVAILLERI